MLVEVNAPIDGRDIDLVQQTFARVAMLGSNTIGRLLFMNIFKSLGKKPENIFLFSGFGKLKDTVGGGNPATRPVNWCRISSKGGPWDGHKPE